MSCSVVRMRSASGIVATSHSTAVDSAFAVEVIQQDAPMYLPSERTSMPAHLRCWTSLLPALQSSLSPPDVQCTFGRNVRPIGVLRVMSYVSLPEHVAEVRKASHPSSALSLPAQLVVGMTGKFFQTL